MPEVDAGVVSSALAPSVVALARDRVPNVRLAAAHALASLARHDAAAALRADIEGALRALRQDADAEVARFCGEQCALYSL